MISLLCAFGIPGLGISFSLPGKLFDLLPFSGSGDEVELTLSGSEETEESLSDEDEVEVVDDDSSPEVVDASTASFSQSHEGGLGFYKEPPVVSYVIKATVKLPGSRASTAFIYPGAIFPIYPI